MSDNAAPGIAEFEDVKRYDPEFRFRQVTGIAAIIVTILACSLSAFHIYTAGFGMLMDMKHRAVHLTVVMTLIFLLYPSRKDDRTRRRDMAGDVSTALIGAVILAFGLGSILHLHFLLTVLVFAAGFGFIAYTRRVKLYRQAGIPYVDIVLAVLGASVSMYILVSYEQIVGRAGMPTTLDLVFGLLAILLVMEAARRAIGWDLPVLAVLCLIYAYFGPYMPGFLAHRGYSVKRIIEHMYLGTEGIYGIPLGVVATYVFHFVLFGIFVTKTGLGQLFIDIAMAIAGRSTGGPAKVAIISSGLLGSINGSSIANTVTTGSFTIPLMKRMGYRPYFAGAVETVASAGGLLMPPIMGSAVFVIMEILGVNYLVIIKAAFLTAILYYAGLFLMIDIEAQKIGLVGLKREEIPPLTKTLKEGWHFFIPLAILIYFLGYEKVSVTRAVFWANISIPFVSFIRKRTRMSLSNIITGLEKGALTAIPVVAILALGGIVVGMITLTGLGLMMSSILIELSQGNLFILLLMTMVASIILGMGVPPVAAYIVLAILVVPALIKMGVYPLAAHLFVFYFGTIAGITPPMAPDAFVAAGIADSPMMKTALTACRLALVIFIIPYIFVYNNALLLIGNIGQIVWVSLTALLGVFALASAVQNYMGGRLSFLFRVVLFGSSLLLIMPGYKTDFPGMGLLLIVSIYQVPHFFSRVSLGFLKRRITRFAGGKLESTEPYDEP